MLKTKVNPKDFLGIRRLNFQPSHLECVDLPFTYNLEKALDKWIFNNLKNRYYIAKTVGLTNTSTVDQTMRVGFEDPKELSYFVLACPHLKYK